jgi:ribosomal protein S6
MAKTSEKYELMYIIDPTWEKRIRRARKEVQGTFEQHGTLDDWRDG